MKLWDMSLTIIIFECDICNCDFYNFYIPDEYGKYSEYLIEWKRQVKNGPGYPLHIMFYEDLKMVSETIDIIIYTYNRLHLHFILNGTVINYASVKNNKPGNKLLSV